MIQKASARICGGYPRKAVIQMKFKKRKLHALPPMTVYGHTVRRYAYEDIAICVSEENEEKTQKPMLLVSFGGMEYNPDAQLMERILRYFGMNMDAPVRCFTAPQARSSERKAGIYFMQEVACV